MNNISSKKTNDWVAFLKFFASICVMMGHTFIVGIPWGSIVLAYGGVYVEFFFILTGYFTTSHFDNMCDEKLVLKIERSLSYTVRKCLRFFPYTIITVTLLHFLYDFNDVISGNYSVGYFVYSTLAEVFCIAKSGVDTIYNGPMWFLCAMFAIFPFYCFFLQIKNKYIKVIISLVLVVPYYAKYGINGLRGQYHDLARAIAGMCIGMVVFFVVRFINNKIVLNRKITIIATLVDAVAFGVSAFFAIFNYGNLLWVCVILYVIMCVLTLSGMSYSERIRSKVFIFLGKLSLPIFLWQWPIGSLIYAYIDLDSWNLWAKLLAYCGGTIVVSVIHLAIVMTIKRITNNYIERKIDSIFSLIDNKLKAFITK